MAFCKTRRANVRPPCLFTSLDKAQHIIVAFVEFRALVRADFNVNKQTINIANISNSSQEYRKYKTGTASLKNAVYYPLLILSINSSDVSISILLWPNKKFKTVETWVGNSFIFFLAPQEPADYQRVFFFRPTFRPTFEQKPLSIQVDQNKPHKALYGHFCGNSTILYGQISGLASSDINRTETGTETGTELGISRFFSNFVIPKDLNYAALHAVHTHIRLLGLRWRPHLLSYGRALLLQEEEQM